MKSCGYTQKNRVLGTIIFVLCVGFSSGETLSKMLSQEEVPAGKSIAIGQIEASISDIKWRFEFSAGGSGMATENSRTVKILKKKADEKYWLISRIDFPDTIGFLDSSGIYDVTGDEKPDLIIISITSRGDVEVVLFEIGPASIENIFQSEQPFSKVRLEDLDQDGDIEIICERPWRIPEIYSWDINSRQFRLRNDQFSIIFDDYLQKYEKILKEVSFDENPIAYTRYFALMCEVYHVQGKKQKLIQNVKRLEELVGSKPKYKKSLGPLMDKLKGWVDPNYHNKVSERRIENEKQRISTIEKNTQRMERELSQLDATNSAEMLRLSIQLAAAYILLEKIELAENELKRADALIMNLPVESKDRYSGLADRVRAEINSRK